jgi:hypothetical protein
VVRTHALEIVDERGTVRAAIKVEEPETAILRMSDKNGRIRVKLGADSDGSGFNLDNNSQQPGIYMKADGRGSVITWEDNAGRAHVVKP